MQPAGSALRAHGGQTGLFTKEFRPILRSSGIKPVRTLSVASHLNCVAARFICSIKSEYLNRMLIFGERHLEYGIREYMEHYHTERPRQGIGNEIIEPPPQGAGENHRPRPCLPSNMSFIKSSGLGMAPPRGNSQTKSNPSGPTRTFELLDTFDISLRETRSYELRVQPSFLEQLSRRHTHDEDLCPAQLSQGV